MTTPTAPPEAARAIPTPRTTPTARAIDQETPMTPTTPSPSAPSTRRWRVLFALAGATTAIGGPLHPDADAEDSLRDELATMTSGDTWVLSHSLIAVGTALFAVALWTAYRGGGWPATVQRSLRVAAVTMSLYVVETVFHLASVVDSDRLAAGEAAPVAFTHVALALVLYPVSGLTFAWFNTRLFRAVAPLERTAPVVGIVAGLLHATSVPLTVVFPDAEVTPVFASAGLLLAAWALLIGAFGVRARRAEDVADGDATASDAADDDATSDVAAPRAGATDARSTAYRRAEAALWRSLDARPTEHEVTLPRLATRVRVQEVGHGEPVLLVHGGPSAGTTWAPLAARLDGYRAIVVDRPGTGLSGPYPVTAADLGPFADVFVLDVLDALGLDRAHVVASSFGGFLALRAAALAPHRFDHMVQMACPAGAPGMAVPPFMRATSVPALRRLMTTLPPNERAARSVLRQIGHGASVDADRFSPELYGWYLSLQRHTDTMRNDMALMGSLVTRRGAVHPALALPDDLLASVAVPTFFYWGADDPFGGEDVARALVAAMPDARLEMVAASGHLPWLDDPTRAATAVTRFLRTTVAAAPLVS